LKFWQFWGLYSHIFAPMNVKFGPCGTKNPFLYLWVKTIPAWLRYAQACR